MLKFYVPLCKRRKVRGEKVLAVVGYISLCAESKQMAVELVEKMYASDTSIYVGCPTVENPTEGGA